jgi:basic membrane lipoprotein Med (substrate-binding protein (PBP1-ABC) superfamily)
MFRKMLLFTMAVTIMSLLVACSPATPTTETVTVRETVVVTAEAAAPTEETAAEAGPLVVFGAYATAIEEPWDGVIHSALLKAQDEGEITYTFTDDIGYAGDMERILREVAEESKPDIIFGDAFGNEEAARRVAADYPEIAFVFGSGGGPAEPNFSVFTTGFTSRPT